MPCPLRPNHGSGHGKPCPYKMQLQAKSARSFDLALFACSVPRIGQRRAALIGTRGRVVFKARFALRTFRESFNARNRNGGNDPVKGDELHALFFDELPLKIAVGTVPDALRERISPRPKFKTKNNHGDLSRELSFPLEHLKGRGKQTRVASSQCRCPTK